MKVFKLERSPKDILWYIPQHCWEAVGWAGEEVSLRLIKRVREGSLRWFHDRYYSVHPIHWYVPGMSSVWQWCSFCNCQSTSIYTCAHFTEEVLFGNAAVLLTIQSILLYIYAKVTYHPYVLDNMISSELNNNVQFGLLLYCGISILLTCGHW